MGSTRLAFKPYPGKIIQEIVTQRLKDTVIFKKDAIKCISLKISMFSSDIRKAL